MQVKSMQLGMINTNCYIFWEESSKECAIVDPGDDGRQIARYVRGQKLTPKAVLLTHSHFDHILGIPGLREYWPDLPVYCHPEDIPEETSDTMFGITTPTVASFSHVLPYEDGDVIPIGPLSVKVLHTPGHTRGSVSLITEDALFSGDTLFFESAGRTDLPGGSYSELLQSLKKLAQLPGDYKVYPGHESTTTLEHERNSNFYLREAVKLP